MWVNAPALSTLATIVAEFGDSVTVAFFGDATVAKFRDNLFGVVAVSGHYSPKSATIQA